MNHVRVGDTVKLKTDFHVMSYDLASRLVSCKMYVNEQGTTKAVDFILPISMPVFKIGPSPYSFVHPTLLSQEHDNFCAYTSEVASLVYLPNQKLKGRLYLPDSFYFDGIFKVMSTTTNIDGKKLTATLLLETKAANKFYAKTTLDELITKRILISGQLVSGKVVAILVNDDLVEEVTMTKLVMAKKHVRLFVYYAFYLQIPMDIKLLTL